MGRGSMAFGVTWGVVLAAGCFDSDDHGAAADDRASTESTTTDATTGGVATLLEETAADSSTGLAGDPEQTCRSAIACVQRCILDLIVTGIPPDPDLTCVVQCTEQLTVDEAYDLLSLANCTSE